MKARARTYRRARAAIRLGVVVEAHTLSSSRGAELFINGVSIGRVNGGQYAKLLRMLRLRRTVPDMATMLTGGRVSDESAEKLKMFVAKNRGSTKWGSSPNT